MIGKLFIVPTPIGNLEDITIRAIKILKNSDIILCENTNNSLILTKKYNIKTKLISYHIYNEHLITNKIVEYIKNGKNISIISDAGTPVISDPGYLIIRECIKNKIQLECLPGPTALIPAIILSGLPNNEFTFVGFLPSKKRKKRLSELLTETRTIILYESPHKIKKTLNDIKIILKDDNRNICVCKEISKKFEFTIRSNINNIHQDLNLVKIKGELVIIIEGLKNKKFMQKNNYLRP